MSTLQGRHIVLGITGGIAAYKGAELLRLLRQAGADVRVVMTQAAKAFITPLTLQALSGHRVHDDLLDPTMEAAMGHIELARWADVILIAPASANCLAALAHGQAYDLLTTLCLASRAPLAVAPAMNQAMWHASATQQNIACLQGRGVTVLGPDSGAQACGETGLGRLLNIPALIAAVTTLFSTGILAGKTVLITAGPTQEAIDPVRYLTNHSSGKMGYALAQAAADAGARVVLITGPVALAIPAGVCDVSVRTALEMQAAVLQHLNEADIFIGCAAVSDYRLAAPSLQKLKKQAELTLTLTRNPDIIATVAAHHHRPFCVGFAAETEHLVAHARKKLEAKNLDVIIANQVGVSDRGFGSDENAAIVLTQHTEKTFPLMRKAMLARELITTITQLYEAYHAENTIESIE